MSVFGILIGIILVVIIFYYEQSCSLTRSIDQSLKKPRKCENKRSLNREPNLIFDQPLSNSIQGPYWNSFYRPTYWTTDDQFLWPYWVWYQRGYVIPGPLYPYYNAIDPLSLNKKLMRDSFA